MNNIANVSDITAQDVAEYIRLDSLSPGDINELNNLITISKSYISSYTGLTLEELDEHEDFIIVVFILCQDMYDNRTLYVDNENVNKVVDTILGMHSVNLL